MKLRSSQRIRRGQNLTPMVDVVFLLLFFFMLASRFGQDLAVPLTLAGGAGDWSGPPRLVEVAAGGITTVNGNPVSPDELIAALDSLMTNRNEPVVIAGRGGATVGELVGLMTTLNAAGFSHLGIAE